MEREDSIGSEQPRLTGMKCSFSVAPSAAKGKARPQRMKRRVSFIASARCHSVLFGDSGLPKRDFFTQLKRSVDKALNWQTTP